MYRYHEMLKKYQIDRRVGLVPIATSTTLLCLIPFGMRHYCILRGHFERAAAIVAIGLATGLWMRHILYRRLGERKNAFLKETLPLKFPENGKTPTFDAFLNKNMRWTYFYWVLCLLFVWVSSLMFSYISFDQCAQKWGGCLVNAFGFLLFAFGWGLINFWVMLAIDYAKLKK